MTVSQQNLYLLNNNLKRKNSNCVDGLMKFTDLWAELGYPKVFFLKIQNLNIKSKKWQDNLHM